MNCLIIEDEKPASDLLRGYIENLPGFHLVAECGDVMSAAQILAENPVDIIFLDINLPKLNGMDFLKTIHGKYGVIITTAYDNYAVMGFDLDVCDYLLKPVSFERFIKAVNKTRDILRNNLAKPHEENSNDYFFVRSENKYEKIVVNDILFVEGLQNYITIQTVNKKVITYSSLKSIESYLSAKEFLRVQKSFIVAISKIYKIDGDDLLIGKTAIPISRSLKDEVMNTILNTRLYRPKGGTDLKNTD